MPKTYMAPLNKYKVEGNHIRLVDGVPAKITGTSLGAILGESPYSTPFQAACVLMGLGKEDISDKPAVKVGVALEPRIISYVGETYGDKGLFMAAEEVYAKREGEHNQWASDFEDDTFAGHVDGIVICPDGTDRILEVKTTINPDTWLEGVPRHYYWQVALYNEFITKQDNAYVALGIVDENTYKSSNNWIANINTVSLFDMPIDREEVREGIRKANAWYEEFILKGVTPDYDPANPGDVELYEHLVNLQADIEDMMAKLDKLKEAEDEIDDAESSIKDVYDRRDELKAEIKDYMVARGISVLESNGYKGCLGTQSRSSFDEAAMVRDGIDPDRYKKHKTVNVFTTKRND